MVFSRLMVEVSPESASICDFETGVEGKAPKVRFSRIQPLCHTTMSKGDDGIRTRDSISAVAA